MDIKRAQQEVDDWIQQFTIQYFKPHEIVTQMSEELGEIANEILKENTERVGKEIGDLTFAFICMANSHNIKLVEEKYSVAPNSEKAFLSLSYGISQIAREINHIYGPKKKKAEEESSSLQIRLQEGYNKIQILAKSYEINMDTSFSYIMKKMNKRDDSRWEKK